MRKYLIGFIIGVVITVPVTALSQTAVDNIQAYLNPNVKITVDGEPLELENTPIIYEQTTYLPLREISEKVMGMSVGWNQETSTVELTTEEAWPTTDVTKRKIEGEEMEIDFSDRGYDKYYNLDESLEYFEIARLVSEIERKIETHETIIEAAKDPENGFHGKEQPYIDELKKLEEILPQWISILNEKLESEGMKPYTVQ